jgi:hypothetical protein
MFAGLTMSEGARADAACETLFASERLAAIVAGQTNQSLNLSINPAMRLV